MSNVNPENLAEARDRRSKSLNRRVFLTTAAAGATSIGFSLNRKADGFPKAGRSGRVRWRFEARRVEQPFLDGNTIPFFRYVSVGNTRSNGNLPLMQDVANRKVAVSIDNLVDFPIQPTIVNYDSGPVIMPGEKGIWNFTMPPAGTWIFTEALLGNTASSAGFAAAMISNPTGQRKAQQDYYLMYQDADDRWNHAIDNGEVPDESVFEPNYHTLNGMSYPETMTDKDTRIQCVLDEVCLIRVANFSNVRTSLHFHGFHVQLIRSNNQDNNLYPPKDTIPIPARSTVELEMHADQVGEYPLHPHTLTSTTDNGFYPGGSLNMIEVENK